VGRGDFVAALFVRGAAMRGLILRFLRDQAGATVVEYGLIVALICFALIEGLSMFTSSVGQAFNTVSNNLVH
jgi:pilus assembly protein Flp/PilA